MTSSVVPVKSEESSISIVKRKILLLATYNKGKVKEIKQILKDLPFEFRTLNDIGFVGKIKETGETFRENAIIKARTVGESTNFLTLAEDSGLEIDALGGEPGVFSARYAKGTDKDRILKILHNMKGIPNRKRNAKFISIVALYNPSNKQVYTFSGESKGIITEKPIGKSGFGYDPIFYNLDLGKTNAQATLEEKNRVSHRARALAKVRDSYIISSNQCLFVSTVKSI